MSQNRSKAQSEPRPNALYLDALEAEYQAHDSVDAAVILTLIRRLREAEELENLLTEAAPHVDSLLCPSVKRTGEPWTHSDLCERITTALKGNEAR